MQPTAHVDSLLSQQAQFRAFLVKRLGGAADAEDVLQHSLIKAVRSSKDLRDTEKLTAWFYQNLRRAATDLIRSREASRARDDAWAQWTSVSDDDDARTNICGCFERLLPALKPRDAELIQRVELANESLAETAKAMGMTPNNAAVALHRARKALRRELERFCGECANRACLDCDCS